MNLLRDDGERVNFASQQDLDVKLDKDENKGDRNERKGGQRNFFFIHVSII
jgi:hypothetical protein